MRTGKCDDAPKQRRVDRCWCRPLTRHETEKLDIPDIEKLFILFHFFIVQGSNFSIREATQDQVHFANAPAPGTQQRAFCAWIEPVAGADGAGHEKALNENGTCLARHITRQRGGVSHSLHTS